jgi:hypothetical protein
LNTQHARMREGRDETGSAATSGQVARGPYLTGIGLQLTSQIEARGHGRATVRHPSGPASSCLTACVLHYPASLQSSPCPAVPPICAATGPFQRSWGLDYRLGAASARPPKRSLRILL